jgi:hypothetical protein
MTPEERDRQLINRVYGNISMENPRVTKEMVAEQLRQYRIQSLETGEIKMRTCDRCGGKSVSELKTSLIEGEPAPILDLCRSCVTHLNSMVVAFMQGLAIAVQPVVKAGDPVEPELKDFEIEVEQVRTSRITVSVQAVDRSAAHELALLKAHTEDFPDLQEGLRVVEASISDEWTMEDVIADCEGLSEEQAINVLQQVKRNFDAAIGTNWSVIRAHAWRLYPEVMKAAEQRR